MFPRAKSRAKQIEVAVAVAVFVHVQQNSGYHHECVHMYLAMGPDNPQIMHIVNLDAFLYDDGEPSDAYN